MLRIALCMEYPATSLGGTEVLVGELVRGLSDDFEIVLVSDDDADSLEASGLWPFLFDHLPWKPGAESGVKAGALAEKLKARGVGLAHFHCGGNYAWGNRRREESPVVHCDRLGIRCVTTVHLAVSLLDGYTHPARPAWFKLLRLPSAWCGKMQMLSHVVAEVGVSDHDAAKLRLWNFPYRSKVRRIYHSRLGADEPIGGGPREATILNVGHIAFRKGQHLLAEAFARVAQDFPEWKLILVGPVQEAACEEEILRITRAHGLEGRILLMGARTDARESMERAAVYVQPSLREALGLALQEALWTGCPAIGTRAGGIPELIDDGQNGLLVEPGSVGALASALRELTGSREKRQALGANGRRSVEAKGMTRAAMIDRHRTLYREVMGDGE